MFLWRACLLSLCISCLRRVGADCTAMTLMEHCRVCFGLLSAFVRIVWLWSGVRCFRCCFYCFCALSLLRVPPPRSGWQLQYVVEEKVLCYISGPFFFVLFDELRRQHLASTRIEILMRIVGVYLAETTACDSRCALAQSTESRE